MWARRSGVDHSLGMGEAPGSNPGESIQRHLQQQLIKSTYGVDSDINPPLLRAPKGRGLSPILAIPREEVTSPTAYP